jgi:Family of unknown function (DUF5367)
MIARWTIVGFVLWLAITVAFMFWGPIGELIQVPGGVPLLFITLPFVLFALTYVFLKILKVEPGDRAEAACVFALPGLLIGIYQINSFDIVFPNVAMRPAEFAALMFACYAAINFAGLMSSRLAQFQHNA